MDYPPHPEFTATFTGKNPCLLGYDVQAESLQELFTKIKEKPHDPSYCIVTQWDISKPSTFGAFGVPDVVATVRLVVLTGKEKDLLPFVPAEDRLCSQRRSGRINPRHARKKGRGL